MKEKSQQVSHYIMNLMRESEYAATIGRATLMVGIRESLNTVTFSFKEKEGSSAGTVFSKESVGRDRVLKDQEQMRDQDGHLSISVFDMPRDTYNELAQEHSLPTYDEIAAEHTRPGGRPLPGRERSFR
jgi:hypothetical protein